MKILFVSETYYPHINGIYYFIQRLAERLQKHGHEVAVLAPSENKEYTDKVIENIRVFGVPSMSLLMYKAIRIPVPHTLKSKVELVFKTFKPDILHLQNHFSINKAALSVNKKYGLPVVGTNHFMTENFTPFYSFLHMNNFIEKKMWAAFSKVFNQLNVVTTPTETGAKLIRPKLAVDVLPISNGIDLTEFTTAADSTSIRIKYGIPAKPVLLYVGRLDPEKHIDEVLRAVATLNSDKFCFVITGKGTIKASLEKLVAKLGIEDKVVLTGFVSNEDLPQLYRLSTCYVTASVAELQSIATMEAMASGLPVIAANAGALAELVHDGENGFLFNPGDTNTLAKCIDTIFSNDILYHQMKNNSLEIIQTHDIRNSVSSFENIYQHCIEIKNHKQVLEDVA
jgi:1,2-diacylglycerol 3-alpha-glucosyltransferase